MRGDGYEEVIHRKLNRQEYCRDRNADVQEEHTEEVLVDVFEALEVVVPAVSPLRGASFELLELAALRPEGPEKGAESQQRVRQKKPCRQMSRLFAGLCFIVLPDIIVHDGRGFTNLLEDRQNSRSSHLFGDLVFIYSLAQPQP